MKLSIKHLALAAAMVVAGSASAQSAGQWTVMAGLNKITPKVDSGDLSAPSLPGSKVDIGSDTQPVVMVTYAYTDNLSVQAGLGLPSKHELSGAGAIAGTGKLGTVKALLPTVIGQYRFFEPKSIVRPYVGLGLTYGHFFDATGSGQLTSVTNIGSTTPTTFKIDNKFALIGQIGVAVSFSDRWFADLSFTKTKLRTRANFSSGQHQDIRLDPATIDFGIGYKF
jgi:outer membrane protein